MKTLCSFVGLVFVLSFFAGCADSIASQTSPSGAGGSQALTAERIEGTWRVLSIQLAGQDQRNTPDGASYTLTFANGRLSTRVDCNTCSGAFTMSGQTLTAGPALACTRAACPTMSFENAYTTLLAGESTVTFVDATLVLSSPRGMLRFAR